MAHELIQINIIIKAILIAIITKIDDHTLTIGSSNPSFNNTYNSQTQYTQRNSSCDNNSLKKVSNQNRYNNKNNYSQLKNNHTQFGNYSQQDFNNNYSNKNNSSYIKNDENYDILDDIYGKNSKSEEKSNNSAQANNANTVDFSSLFSSFFQNNDNQNSNNSNLDFNMPDMETMLKFKKIFDCINSKTPGKDPIVNLLYAFKPFMQESKKSIIDQLTKFISISSVLHEFNNFL